jgi:type II secretory pathway pseudopilin PulG
MLLQLNTFSLDFLDHHSSLVRTKSLLFYLASSVVPIEVAPRQGCHYTTQLPQWPTTSRVNNPAEFDIQRPSDLVFREASRDASAAGFDVRSVTSRNQPAKAAKNSD